MLVLSRRPGERIVIGDNIVVTVLSVDGPRVRLGLEAPGISIRREELPPLTLDRAASSTAMPSLRVEGLTPAS